MIKAAVIGLGWWGQTILNNLRNNRVIVPVLAVDPLDQARALASRLRIETAPRFEDALVNTEVEAVILCTPQQQHAEQIIASAESGRHVFCEKPLCTTAADAEAAVTAVRRCPVRNRARAAIRTRRRRHAEAI
jgi:predicted dehydrogenase